MGNHHHPKDFNTAFALATALNLLYVVTEVIYALYAGSMSLLADAAHNFGDVLGLVLAWGANWLLLRPASERYSYGYKKTSILASLTNALILVGTSVLIGYESILKLIDLEPVREHIVIAVAAIGIVINGGTALLFLRGHDDLNIKSAFVHLAADALISIGVVATGFMILWKGWHWLDPVVGLLIVVAILVGTWGLLRDSVSLTLMGVPRRVNQKAITTYLESIPGVQEVHDLHIWGLSTRDIALTAHLVMDRKSLSDKEIHDINKVLHSKYNIDHPTLQVEAGSPDYPCIQKQSC